MFLFFLLAWIIGIREKIKIKNIFVFSFARVLNMYIYLFILFGGDDLFFMNNKLSWI